MLSQIRILWRHVEALNKRIFKGLATRNSLNRLNCDGRNLPKNPPIMEEAWNDLNRMESILYCRVSGTKLNGAEASHQSSPWNSTVLLCFWAYVSCQCEVHANFRSTFQKNIPASFVMGKWLWEPRFLPGENSCDTSRSRARDGTWVRCLSSTDTCPLKKTPLCFDVLTRSHREETSRWEETKPPT